MLSRVEDLAEWILALCLFLGGRDEFCLILAQALLDVLGGQEFQIVLDLFPAI